MGYERTTALRRVLVGLTMIVLIAVSACVGLLVANWPDCVHYLRAGQ